MCFDVMNNVGDAAALSQKDMFQLLGLSKPAERK